jgi:transcriptional regulator with XRE-family HTH domain
MIDGQRIRQLREAQGYTRRELSDKIGMTEMQIIRYESGKSDATGEALTRLAAVLNVSTDYLLGITDVPTPNLNREFTPDELAVIDAWRRGDYRQAMKIMSSGE